MEIPARSMFDELKRLNDMLPGLVVGILIYGVLVEVIGVWFVADKLGYSVGLVIGIACACWMAINMATVIRDSVETCDEAQAKRIAIGKANLRYTIVAAVFIVMVKLEIGNLLTAFLGVMGLKVSAYLQPLAHKFMSKLRGRGGVSSDSEDIKLN